jgi:hypothetical protein
MTPGKNLTNGISDDDCKEKKNVGELWEESDPEKNFLFLIAVKEEGQETNVRQQVEAKIRGIV